MHHCLLIINVGPNSLIFTVCTVIFKMREHCVAPILDNLHAAVKRLLSGLLTLARERSFIPTVYPNALDCLSREAILKFSSN